MSSNAAGSRTWKPSDSGTVGSTKWPPSPGSTRRRSAAVETNSPRISRIARLTASAVPAGAVKRF